MYTSADGQTILGKRKSPKSKGLENLFEELVSFPQLALKHSFSLEAILIREEELRVKTNLNSWSRKQWRVLDRRLLEVVDRIMFQSSTDYLKFLPSTLPSLFTSRDLASTLNKPFHLAQKIAYCLRRMNVINVVGKKGNSLLYTISVKSSNKTHR